MRIMVKQFGAQFVTHDTALSCVGAYAPMFAVANVSFVNTAVKMPLQASIFTLYVNAACAERKGRREFAAVSPLRK